VAALQQHGARHVIVSNEEDLGERVRSLTDGKGARVIFDAVAGDTLNALIGAASPRACIVVYGTLAGAVSSVVLPPAMLKGVSIRGYAMNEFVSDPDNRSRALEFVYYGLGTGKLRPVIDRVFPLEEIAAAYRHLESNTQVGKIVVRT
jgi:NADPH:quinone reductase-like Zn-dependent oxidoreductase